MAKAHNPNVEEKGHEQQGPGEISAPDVEPVGGASVMATTPPRVDLSRDEFLDSLRTTHQVRFGQSARIVIGNPLISPAVARDLGAVLALNERVRYGLHNGELARLPNSDAWRGTIHWWLATSRAVVRVTIEAGKDGTSIECRRYPTHILGICDLTAMITPDGQRYALALRWEGEELISLDSSTFEAHGGREAVRLFAAAVLHDA